MLYKYTQQIRDLHKQSTFQCIRITRHWSGFKNGTYNASPCDWCEGNVTEFWHMSIVVSIFSSSRGRWLSHSEENHILFKGWTALKRVYGQRRLIKKKKLLFNILSLILQPGSTKRMHTWKVRFVVFVFMDSNDCGLPKFENSRIWILSSNVIISSEFWQKQHQATTVQLWPQVAFCIKPVQISFIGQRGERSSTSRVGGEGSDNPSKVYHRRKHRGRNITPENCTHKRIQ